MTTCIRRPHSVWTTCPCDDCAIDRRRAAKRARVGLYQRVPSEAAWAVIDRLRDRGWSGWAIASAAGLPRFTIERAVGERERGANRAFGPTVAARIVNHGQPTEGTVGVRGARRRLQGLARQGFTLEYLADSTGLSYSTLAAIRNGGTTTYVKVAFHHAIAAAADEVGMSIGPSPLATMHAARKGWPSLLAWDDIDDPHEVPTSEPRGRRQVDEAVVLRLLAGDHLPCSRAEKSEAMRRWKASGGSEREFCMMHGWHAGRYGRGAA